MFNTYGLGKLWGYTVFRHTMKMFALFLLNITVMHFLKGKV